MEIEQYIRLFGEISEPIAKPLWVSDFEAVSTHIRGNKDNDIIKRKRPNEEDEIHQYRMDNYRAITKHPFSTAKTNLVRIMNHPDVVIRYPQGMDGLFQNTNFEDKDLKTFFQTNVLESMIEMANGFIVPWPQNVAQDESEMTNSLFYDLIIVNPKDVVHMNEYVFTFLSKEKSTVTYKNREMNVGNVYYCIHRDGLWKRVQIGKKSENKYEWVEYYSNPIGVPYALVLGGDLTSDEVQVEKGKKEMVDYFTSYFSSAVPFADECISQFSDHQGTLVSSSFPIREMDSIECTATGCSSGYVVNEKGSRVVCNTCNGTGRVPIAPGPYGVFLRPKKGKFEEGPESVKPVVDYLHPDVAILQFGGEVWEKYLKYVKDALNLLFIDEAQSGVAKSMDREDKIATLDKIARNLYNLLKNTVQIIWKFENPNSDEYPIVSVQLPSTFVEKTIEQKQAEIKGLREIQAPNVLLSQRMRSLHSSLVNNDPLEMRIYDIATMVDPFYLKSLDEKIKLQAIGVLDELSLAMSEMTPHVIRKVARENEEFLSLADNEIIELYDALMEEERTRIEERIASRPATSTFGF